MNTQPFAESAHPAPGSRRATRLLSALGCVGLLAFSVYFARDVAGSDPAVASTVAKAQAFLESLDAGQRSKVLLEFDSARKSAWSNLPVTMVRRNGLPLGQLTPRQRAAAMDVLAAVLSKEGFQKIVNIMSADDRLVRGDNRMRFGTDNYYVALFGKPSANSPWMVQFGGHHLGLNVTLVGKASVLTPTHTGAQPDAFMRDGETIRPLGAENDLAFELVNRLDDRQRKEAVLGDRPRNLVLGPGQDGKAIPPSGLKCHALTADQRALLLKLVGAWVHILPEDDADRRLAALRSRLGESYFAWYGPTTNGSAAYYRIQGPTLWIEYAPQGTTHHIHTIIRDPSDDYGKKLIAS